ncbi:MAG TPA: aromatic-ring-hydroxylating dioxygenase subunit beta [Pseudonocardia sp.]|nr:aromatic-ring-hydroxylating dioxygenase subunit beta [Pseudonocardia sp.]
MTQSQQETVTECAPGPLVDMATWFQVNRFYTEEARLLDTRQFDTWLTLFTPDTRYWVPIRKTRMTSSKAGDRNLDLELSGDNEPCILDEGLPQLALRVARLHTVKLLWSDNPPGRCRHLITNVEANHTDSPDELAVRSNFVMMHGRFDEQGTHFYGERRDTLRRVDGSLKIASRKVVLDSTVLWAPAITTFF